MLPILNIKKKKKDQWQNINLSLPRTLKESLFNMMHKKLGRSLVANLERYKIPQDSEGRDLPKGKELLFFKHQQTWEWFLMEMPRGKGACNPVHIVMPSAGPSHRVTAKPETETHALQVFPCLPGVLFQFL